LIYLYEEIVFDIELTGISDHCLGKSSEEIAANLEALLVK